MQRRRPNQGVLEIRTVDILSEIARRYYLGDDSQIEIARDLGLDPSTVSRYLKRARDEGIVHVEIRTPRRPETDLGQGLAERYRLRRVVVSPSAEGPDEREPALAGTAAAFIDGLLVNGLRLGVSWGRTLADVVHHLRPGTVARLEIAQLAGGVEDPSPGIQGHDLVRRLAELYPGSRVHYLHAPAIVGSDAAGRAFVGDRIVRSALAAGRASQLALVGIGQMDAAATLRRGGHVSRADWGHLAAAGAVANVNTRFIDAHGQSVPELDLRTIAIGLDDLRAIDTVVAVAGGPGKVGAIRAALLSGAIDVLVTDEATAISVLALDAAADA
jgi:DNA-binding transcriptional regulator LsrR (DeoR family)